MKTHTKSTLPWQAFALLSIVILLSACGGDKSNLGAAEETIEITDSSDANQTIDRSRPYELIISGNRKTIIVANNNNITQLTISGSNNMVTLSSGTTVDSLTFTGDDNTATKLSGSVITSVGDQGSGNGVNNS